MKIITAFVLGLVIAITLLAVMVGFELDDLETRIEALEER